LKVSNIIWRIDDRLIHGQVIIGWCDQLSLDILAVCDDEIATLEWEKNLLLMAAPPNLTTHILTTPETVEKAKIWKHDKNKVLVLLKSPAHLEKLISAGAEINKVNIGGIHYRPDRKEYLPYVFLSEEEIKTFSRLMENDIQFECRDLPNSAAHDLKKLLRKKNA
jgi:mannose/fructose/N-acetylgalactosamine-specific phosphotransferase system component IIB